MFQAISLRVLAADTYLYGMQTVSLDTHIDHLWFFKTIFLCRYEYKQVLILKQEALMYVFGEDLSS